MIRYECDGCGCALDAGDGNRFIVKMEIFAAAGQVEFTEEELRRDHTAEIRSLIERLGQADPDDIEDRTYRCLSFDLCPACQRSLLADPLGTERRSADRG